MRHLPVLGKHSPCPSGGSRTPFPSQQLLTHPLFQAVQKGDAGRLRNLFFDQGLSRYVDSKYDDGCGLLHIFGLCGGLDEAEAIMDAVVEDGGDINVLSNTKETALIVALPLRKAPSRESAIETQCPTGSIRLARQKRFARRQDVPSC